jgi:glycerol uptake facilitator-like aquaporin
VIVVGAITGGPISGGAFNPAVATAGILTNALNGSGSLIHLAYYWVGPLFGALLAVVIFRMQEASESG